MPHGQSRKGVRAVTSKFIGWSSALFMLLAFTSACTSPLIRSQSPELDLPEDTTAASEVPTTRLIGDVAKISGLHAMKVEGVGLVNRLPGTGSDPPPSPLRDILLSEIHTHHITGASQLVASPSNSLVTVTAYLPPGVRKGDYVDATVRVPRGPETTSLQGGFLLPVRLQEMRLIQNRVRTGAVAAEATGNVVIDSLFEGDDDSVNLLRGRVMGGVHSRIDRPIHLVLREEHRSARLSKQIGRAINARFHYYDRGEKKGVAKPLNDRLIELNIPENYRTNIYHYTRVIRRLPILELASDRIKRMDILGRKLMEPTTASVASTELEAIGKDAARTLRHGLQSPDPEVRFYAAESGAFLDIEEVVDHLAEAIENEPAFRWHALAALTSMHQIAASEALANLLHSTSAETRYGAFRALRKRNPRDPLARPEKVWGTVEYHVLPTSGPHLIHFSRTDRQEITLFGLDIPLRPPAVLFAGKQILVKGTSDGRIKVTQFSNGKQGDRHLVCEPKLHAVLQAVGELGAGYGNMLSLCRQARSNGDLQARLVVHALALPGRRYYRDSKDLNSEDSDESAEHGRRPQMFEDNLAPGETSRYVAGDGLPSVNPTYQASEIAPKEPGFWGGFRLWGTPK